jgi:gliding motility-associated-like protein
MTFLYFHKKIPRIKYATAIAWLFPLFVCIAFSTNSYAQPCITSQFVKSYDFVGNGVGYFLGRLNSGGLYFGGLKNGHLVLHTTDINGNPVWDKQYQCPQITAYASYDLASIDSSGNYFVSTNGTGIGLLDAGGNVITSKQMNNIRPGMFCISIGVLSDNKKVVLLRDQIIAGITNGYALICLSADLSTIIWTRYFSNKDCAFFTLNISNNKIIVPGQVGQVGTLLCFDGNSGNTLSVNAYKNGINHTFFDKIYKYNGGYIVQGRRWVSSDRPYMLIMRLDDNLNVINSYLLNEVGQNASLALSVERDGSYHGAWGTETDKGSYSFAMSNNDQVVWSINNGSINFRPEVYINTPEGLTILSYGFQSSGNLPVTNSSLVVSRTNQEGELYNCPSTDYSLGTAGVDYLKSNPLLVPVDTSYITLLPTPMDVSNDTYNLVEGCKNLSSCNAVTIIGSKDLCRNTAQFIARRNKGCTVPVIWTLNDDSVIQTKMNDSTVSFQFHRVGTYTLVATLAGCKFITDKVQVNITSLGTVLNLGRDTALCPGTTILLNARKGFSSYLWQNGSRDSTLMVTQPGKYFVTVTDACGGIFRDTIIVGSNPPILFDAGPDRVKCENDPVQLTGTPGFARYLWNNNDTTSTITVDKAGLYWLQVTDDNGCVGKKFVTVSLKECSLFYIPNAFTPNHDGLNDIFKPVISGNLVHYSFAVYNRYGQKVFESTNLSQGWDGSFYNRKNLIGVFVWTCSYQFSGLKMENKRGTVMLIR